MTLNEIRELREKAFNVVHEARDKYHADIAANGGEPTAEMDAAVDAALLASHEIEQRAAREEKMFEISNRASQPTFRPTVGGGEPESDGIDYSRFEKDLEPQIRAYATRGVEQRHHVRASANPDYRQAFASYIARGKQAMSPDQLRALSEGVDTAGGFLVPVDVDMRLLYDSREPAVIRSISDVSTTSRDRVRRPSSDRISIGWGAEAAAPTEQDTDFGEVEVTIGKLIAITKASTELEEDSAFNLASTLGMLYGDASNFEEEKAFTTGDGVNKPVGITFGTRVTRVDTATNDVFVADDLLKVHYNTPARYRVNGTWLMESLIELEVRKFKAATSGDYLWQPSLQAGSPSTLLGRPVRNPDGSGLATAVADQALLAIFGDFKQGYWIVDRVGTSVQRLDELYAGNDQIGWKIRKRVGGNVALANALRILRVQ